MPEKLHTGRERGKSLIYKAKILWASSMDKEVKVRSVILVITDFCLGRDKFFENQRIDVLRER